MTRKTGGREKTRVFQIMDFIFFVKKRGFAGGEGVNPKIRKKGGFTVVGDRKQPVLSNYTILVN